MKWKDSALEEDLILAGSDIDKVADTIVMHYIDTNDTRIINYYGLLTTLVKAGIQWAEEKQQKN